MGEKAKQVYAVSHGSYSDYRVSAVFSTREKAQAFIDAVNDSDVNEIEVYDLNPPTSDIVKRGYKAWRVYMDRAGNVQTCEVDMGIYSILRANDGSASLCGAIGKPQSLSMTTWAKDSVSAIKIANEKRAEMIALGKWEAVRRG